MTKYLNFPVELMRQLWEHPSARRKFLNNAFDYAIYRHWHDYSDSVGEPGDENYEPGERTKDEVLEYFEVTAGDIDGTMCNGEKLYNTYGTSAPMAGISTTVFFDYYENGKNDHEWALLAAHLAIKSILYHKAYCKATNLYIWSRMAGCRRAVDDVEKLPKEMRKYTERYQWDKIKRELMNGWGLRLYAIHTRGMYLSFKLPVEKLVFEVEKKRMEHKSKPTDEYKMAAAKARAALGNMLRPPP